ncbi:ABC transporter permease [Halorussus salilacus]|uniref:ABC transporter permease n=1 Tax=Halorussus salilacus TaxID=2953750 RepID=UPI0020A0ABA4|nr:ABC transporter permease [Halorussus salilacus]USZ68774.1 ABC transporter permease [Halorussus salilacus]
MSVGRLPTGRRLLVALGGLAVAALLAVELLFPANPITDIAVVLATIVVDANYVSSVLRLTVPIAFAALGGIFAEKSGVINIGLEGLLIISAFTSLAAAAALGGGDPNQTQLWLGFGIAVLVSTLFALLFAIVCIEFKADQIIAGLAVWLIALGLAPFASKVIWGQVNSPTIGTFDDWTVPLLAEIPFVGPVLFDASPMVYLLLVAVAASWYVLNRTAFGRWIEASGENPKALDTVGVDVRKVRYAGVLLSGFLSGIGGAGLAIGRVGQFIGGGTTMINGRGWIGITAYLFGNYNPVGAFGGSFLFASLDALQFRLQQVGYNVPSDLIGIIPYVTVVVVLAFVGRTRIPSAAGEHYESGEE